MSLKFYSKKEISQLLKVSEEDFHRGVKKLIKREFKIELEAIGVTNPDILLDNDNMLFLADPNNHNNFFATNLSIFDYIEENE